MVLALFLKVYCVHTAVSAGYSMCYYITMNRNCVWNCNIHTWYTATIFHVHWGSGTVTCVMYWPSLVLWLSHACTHAVNIPLYGMLCDYIIAALQAMISVIIVIGIRVRLRKTITHVTEPQAHFLTKQASTDRELPQKQANTFLLYTLALWLTFKLCIFDSKTHFISKLWVFWILKSHDWTLFRNTTYSVAQVLNCVANENDKRVLVKKETAIAIIVNIKSKIYKFHLVA